MRALIVIAVAATFGAMLLFDTAALIRLGLYCVSGGCGVEPTWLAVGAVLVVGSFLAWSRWRPARTASAAKRAPRSPRKAAATARKPRRARPGPTGAAPRRRKAG